ncbi:hypothetical protein PR202_ga27634 [Eleusine coracana subsp. coracana]|uniref:Protein kinase domain-containing protein n=1 Tax=Eleusine coracana subsp. coracana TaxID=191504 RepID=A0AAV5DFA5_ELECO|nr:hypothetical protein PR202_ga27634 [Eleusine coracana subsp. coracana]
MLESIVEGRNKPGILPYHLLQLVTDNFSKEHEIGSGDSAVVFKVKIKQSTLRGVAVKKFISGVGEQMFHREVEISMTSRHPNVLRFFGYCSYAERLEECNGRSIMTETRERLLCYEYLSNGSLRNHLSTASCGLEWKYRYQIIKGICEGLQYLHGNRIAHLDLRPENILLDDNMVPKLFRFYRSMRFEENQSQNTTTDVMGHLVYMAPEYKYKNQVTLKVDVFSLGVTISEILTGEREYFAANYMVRKYPATNICMWYIPLLDTNFCNHAVS